MIVCRNPFKLNESDNKLDTDQYEFKINGHAFSVNKKMRLYHQIYTYYNSTNLKEEQLINSEENYLSNPESKASLTKNISEDCNIQDSDYDEKKFNDKQCAENKIYSDSTEYLSDDDNKNLTTENYIFDDHDDSNDSYENRKKFTFILKSNYDGKYIKDDNRYLFQFDDSDFFFDSPIEYESDIEEEDSSDNSLNDKSEITSSAKSEKNNYNLRCNYYHNYLFNIYNMTFKIDQKSENFLDSIAQNLFQLFLDGYDIIITDFIVEKLLFYAKMFNIQELIDTINQLNDLNEQNQFIELEILQKLEDTLDKIDENTIDVYLSTIFSIYIYIGEKFFESFLLFFDKCRSTKHSVYLKLAKIIKSRYSFKKINWIENSYYWSIPHIKSYYLPIIYKDDVDSLQKLLNQNPKIKICEISVNLKKCDQFINPMNISENCNLIECSAFFGSIKCFKYLLLNENNWISDNLTKYAIAGGNIEIIHICDQKKCSFKYTLNVALDFHRIDVARWIIENDKDDYNISILFHCINTYNFGFLIYLLDLFSDKINNEEIILQYLLYANEKVHLLEMKDFVTSYNYFFNFLVKFPIKKDLNPCRLIDCPKDKMKIIQFILRNQSSYISGVNDILIFCVYFHF